ncbi:MAG: hypothetical protein ACU85V_00405 [Gammaproteobacteria bacterium]
MLMLGGGAALAGDFDGSKVMICAPADTFQCNLGAGCVKGEAESVNLDRFITVDAGGKTIAGMTTGRTASITQVAQDGGQLILLGHQNGRGWTMSISEQTGDMTATVAASNESFSVFGACIAKP